MSIPIPYRFKTCSWAYLERRANLWSFSIGVISFYPFSSPSCYTYSENADSYRSSIFSFFSCSPTFSSSINFFGYSWALFTLIVHQNLCPNLESFLFSHILRYWVNLPSSLGAIKCNLTWISYPGSTCPTCWFKNPR